MTDRVFNFLERLLGLAGDGLSTRELAVLSAVLLLLAATATIVYVRRIPVAAKAGSVHEDAAAPYRSPPPVTIHVNGGHSTSSVHVGTIAAGSPLSEPPRQPRANAARSYKQLRRIAALPGDDEDFTVS